MNDEDMKKFNRKCNADAEKMLRDAIENHEGHLKCGDGFSPMIFEENEDGTISLFEPDGEKVCVCTKAINAVIIAKSVFIATMEYKRMIYEKGKEAIERQMREDVTGKPSELDI